MRLERRNCETGVNGIDIHDHGTSYRQTGLWTEMEMSTGVRGCIGRPRGNRVLLCTGQRKDGAWGSRDGATGVVEMNLYLKDFHQSTVKITTKITVLSSLTFNVLPVFKFYYYNPC